MIDIELSVNGERRAVTVGGSESLLFTLRESLQLPGSKGACEQGECGSCSLILDDELVCACLVMAADCDGSQVVTVEGLGSQEIMHAVQQALLDHGAIQCGFCTPGFVMAATHLFDHQPTPSHDDIREALSGNICRCTGYGAIMRALEELAGT